MSLKQECVDFIKLITEPLQTAEEYAIYHLEENSYRDICILTGEDITYGDCSGCEHSKCESEYGKDISCPHLKEHFKVDVNFWDCGDFERNYVFAGGKEGRIKGVTYINSRRQFMEEMALVKKELESFRDYCAKFGKMYEEFMDYAKVFADQLQQEYFFFSGFSSNVLPIVFYTDNAKDISGQYDFEKAGDLITSNKNQTVINCYCSIMDIEATKRTIRHEILHYALYVVGMKNGDETAIFHYLCEKYGAHAWKKMPEQEQKIYDNFKMIIEYFDTREGNHTNDEVENCKNQLIGIMLTVIGEYKELPEIYEECQKLYDIMYEMAKSDNVA